jgi:thiol:disulfide interchange protein DsbA
MMKNSMKWSIVLAALLMFGGAVQAQTDKPVPYQEDLHYFLIDKASVEAPEKAEVTELFSYLCTHCYTFETYIEGWLKRKPENVVFKRIPVVFGRSSWELYARGYVTAGMMDLPDEAHAALMDRLWKEKKIIRSMDELADFYTQFGADKEKFLSTSRSFAVDGKLRKDQLMVQTYGVRGTPSMVVNGKYRVSANAAVPSFDVMLDIVDYLIEMDSAEKE